MTYIIAEFGSNAWPFTREKLTGLLIGAAEANVDAVKVQLFRADHFPNEERKAKARYEFPRDEFAWFVNTAHMLGLAAGASVFDQDAVDLCVYIPTDFIKLASREEDNHSLRKYVQANYRRTIVRSVAYPPKQPIRRMPREVTLGCISEYPTIRGHWLLPDFHTLLPKPYGWSSHTMMAEDCLAATGLGAVAIEKHMRLFDNDPEALWSLTPKQMGNLVWWIRLYNAVRR